MTGLPGALKSLNRRLAQLESIVAAVFLVGLIILGVTQAVMRNAFDRNFPWMDSILRHAVFFIGFIGAAIASSGFKQINIDMMARLLKPRARMALEGLVSLATVAVCGLFIRLGWAQYKLEAANPDVGHDDLITAATGQLAIPVGFAVIALHHLIGAVLLFHGARTGEAPVDEDRPTGEAAS